MKILISILLMFAHMAKADQPNITFAFGSCAHQDKDQSIWDEIATYEPAAFFFLGDNVYADTESRSRMLAAYNKLATNPYYSRFRKSVPIIATWDDHDYGLNDGGADYRQKEMSKSIFLDFFGYDAPELKSQDGIYHSRIITSEGTDPIRVQVIMLDTRYNRTRLLSTSKQGHKPNYDPKATILGQRQWTWLEGQLQTEADVRIIGSSIQFLSDNHRWEKWGNFPLERQKLISLIGDTGADNVFIISGDRHSGEISRLESDKLSSPLYDITSSGMTNRISNEIRDEENKSRLPGTRAHKARNFGILRIWKDKDRGTRVEAKLLDQDSAVLEAASFWL